MKNDSISLVLLIGLPFLLAVVIFLHACKHESHLADIPEICFERDVLPVFQTSCGISGCHDASSGGYDFTNYSGILSALEPGNPDKSAVYKSITEIWSNEMMPPSQPLSIENRILIRIWIEQGARNIECPDTSGTDTIPDPPDTIPEIKQRACFERDILPIFISSCGISGCHDATTAEEDLVLTSYNGIRYNEKLSPFNPNESEIYQVIVTTEPDERMPPAPQTQLSKAQTDSIYKWILYGALNEECLSLCDTTSVNYSNQVSNLIRNYCLGCHSGASPSGSISFGDYSSVKTIADNGKLLGVIRRQTGFKPMPPDLVLTDCPIRTFEIWVSTGTPE